MEEKSTLVKWAEKELDLLLKKFENEEDEGYEMQKHMNEGVLEIIETFASQGHSGFSASIAIAYLNRLLRYKPILPLTGEESEWGEIDVETNGDDVQQNKRCSAVFRRNQDNSTAYFIHGKVFSDNGGESWFSCSKSRIPVKFPFVVPEKPEYIILKEGEEPK